MTALTQEQLEEATLRLSAGRIRAMEQAPYLSTALLSLTPTPREGFGTFAVDVHWHMYYDPALCLEWTISEIAAVWLHEVNHVLRKHGTRFEQYNEPHNARMWNAAADGAINSDLKEMGVVLPDPESRYYAEARPETPNWHKGMTAEEMYETIRGKGSSPQDDNKGESQDSSPSSDDAEESESTQGDDQKNAESDSTEGTGSDSSNEDADSSTAQNTEKSDSDEQAEGDNESTSSTDGSDPSTEPQAEDSEADGAGNDSEGAEGDSSEQESDEAGAGSGSEEADSSASGSGTPSSNASSGDSSSQEGSSSQDAVDQSSVGCDCGSGADGLQRPEDLGEDEDAITSGEADAIARATAKAITDYEKSRPGSVPGGLKRVADEIMNPEVNWQRLLMVKVRAKVAEIVGRQDYSYKRPSRRRQSGNFIFPSMRSNEKPYIYIIIDTSGSMSDTDLARALSEIAALLKRYRGRVYVLACDADGTEATLVKKLKDIELMGGGGTDMRKGIRIAAKSRPTPDVVIVITDGYTPWPKTIPTEAPRAKYIALIVQAKASVEATARKNFQLPDWFDVVTAKRR